MLLKYAEKIKTWFENSYQYKENVIRENLEAEVNKIFAQMYHVYMNAAIFGLLYSRTAECDNTSNDRARIYADAFSGERDNCMFLYRMVMLLDMTSEITTEERINRAFRYDSQPDKVDELKQNLDIIDRTHEVMTTFKKELEGKISYEDEIAKLMTS